VDGALATAGRHHIRLHVDGHEQTGAPVEVLVPRGDAGEVRAGAGERGPALVGHRLGENLGIESLILHGFAPLNICSARSAYDTVGRNTWSMGSCSGSPQTCRQGKRTSCSAYSALSRPSPAP